MVGFRVRRSNARDFCHHMSSKSIMPGFVTNFTSAKKMKSGASQCKAACNCDSALPAQTLIQSVCYPELNK